MNLILFDDAGREHLLPFTFTRPCADIRIGICTIREKWDQVFGSSSSSITVDYLAKKFSLKNESENLLINGRLLPDDNLIKAINLLKQGQQLISDDFML